MVDQDGDQRLSIDEFLAAQFIAYALSQGQPFPKGLPKTLRTTEIIKVRKGMSDNDHEGNILFFILF